VQRREYDLSDEPTGPKSPEPRPGSAQRTGAAGSGERRAATGDSQVRAGGKKKRGALGMVIEVVVIVAAAFVIALLVQWLLVKPFTIHQISMEPTLIEGDRVLISRLTYHFRDPESGDVVVFDSPINENEDLVKRVVAVAGDEVAIKDGALYVNGVAQEEPYLLEQDFEGYEPGLVVPEGQAYVLGDNRNNSGDSRIFGPIAVDSIIGNAFVIYWPISHWGGL
jgi:signal peptidase I